MLQFVGDEFVVDFEFYGYCVVSECHCQVSDPKNRGCQSCCEFCEGIPMLVMWEVVPESRYQSDLELPIVLAMAMYVRLFRLEFPSSAWFDLVGLCNLTY